jgi:hypothetical protein
MFRRRGATIGFDSVRLEEWIGAWTCVAEYASADVPDVDQRISKVLELWHLPVAEGWLRPAPEDDMWAAAPYRRRDRGAPSSPERAVEHEILGPGPRVAPGRACLGGAIVGGINAVPLTLTPKIEADLLLLVQHTSAPRLYLAEVKSMANTPWYATIELLRQLRLLLSGSPTLGYFHRTAGTPSDASMTGLIVAPQAYFDSEGKRHNAVSPARRLIQALKPTVDIRLATWDSRSEAIAELG